MDIVAIVILNWNGRQMLERYLPTVLEHSRSEAVTYVADNGSTDDSLEWVEDHWPEVKTIRLGQNWGFAEGYNKALAQVEAEYVVLLNSDVETTPQWLTPLIAFMDAHADVAACQPKLLSVTDRRLFEYAGASGGFLDRYGYPFCRGRVFATVEADDGQYDTPCDVLWATGACLLIRRRDYQDVGGLDARFFAHCEEIDLCWRLRSRGRRIVCLPQSSVCHVGGGTLPKNNPMKTYLNFRNNLTMLYKNLPEGDLRRVMRVRRWLDWLAAFEMLVLERHWGDFKAVLRARRDFRRWKKDFDDDRAANLQAAVGDDVNERKSICLLWQYYVKGRKRFSDLRFPSVRSNV